MRARWGAELPADIAEFIQASQRATRGRRLRFWGAIAAAPLTVALLLVTVWAGLVWRGVRQVEAEMAFARIPAGCFVMGSPDDDPGHLPDEGPVHRVCLDAFDLGLYEVTQDEWRRVMIFPNIAYPSIFEGSGLPAESVSWDEAQRFVQLMSLFGRRGYHLPSEAEYEYAERAGTGTPYYWGTQITEACRHENVADLSLQKVSPGPTVVYCDDHYAYTAPVGSFEPNPWGLYDIDGNVAAWVADCYVDNYVDAPADGGTVGTPACTRRVIRGSSWGSRPNYLRSASRNWASPVGRNYFFGVRLVRVP